MPTRCWKVDWTRRSEGDDGPHGDIDSQAIGRNTRRGVQRDLGKSAGAHRGRRGSIGRRLGGDARRHDRAGLNCARLPEKRLREIRTRLHELVQVDRGAYAAVMQAQKASDASPERVGAVASGTLSPQPMFPWRSSGSAVKSWLSFVVYWMVPDRMCGRICGSGCSLHVRSLTAVWILSLRI